MNKITSQKQYNWKRYWVKRGGNINLSDGDGFLYDPDSEYGDIFNPDAMSFDTINNIPCLVLLGEPGIGKSYTIKTHVDKLKKDGEEPFFLDLRSFGSEDRLIRKLFESDIFVRWVKGEHNLHLYLDSLDECLLQIKTLAALLIDELQGYPVERLFLRITCRTAEWPEMLEDGLKKLWGKEAVDVYQLAPLRRVDVKVAAEARNIDPETFLNEIEIKEAHPFANKPVTLEFLLTAFQTTGQFPDNRTELYLQGCRLLCDELNLNRRSAGFTGNLAPEQRLIVAARIAALTMFSNRYAISTDPDMGNIPEEDLSMKDLVGGHEDVLGEYLEINETIIHEALSTGLFISCGPSRMRWAHQTYAEFLAARYLYIHNMTIPQVMSLLTHPGDDGKLVPQLYETSAWLAAMRPEIFREIAKIDAEVLLRGDVATAEACRRKLLVDCLLKLLNEEKLPRFDWGRRNLYRKLFHPALAEQLLPLLQNSTASISAKVAAIQITHFCEVQPLYGTLADIALNDTESIDIRVEAAYTLAKVGDENSRSRLKPLASKEFSEDIEDQLKGCILQALWPDYLSAHELFNVLTFPKRPNFTGAYDRFIRKRLPQHLKPEHLPTALEWIEKQGEHKFRLPTYHIFGELIDKIMLKAWEYFDQEGISEVFSRLTLEYLADSDYRSHAENTTLRNAIKKNKNKRRKLLIGLLPFISYPERKDRSHMVYYSSKIILPEDVPWILECLKESQSQDIQRKLAELIKYVFPHNDGELINEILKASKDNEIIAEAFSRIFKTVRLDSPEAQEMKADYYKEEERQKRAKEPPLLEPSPQERVALCLEKFESGNLSAWGRLTMEITLEPRSTHYDSISKADLTSFPGWENADSETRRRIIEAARNYILNGDPEKSKWFNKGKYYGPAIAGYKAFFLLLREKPDFVYNFPQAVWKKWVCVIISEFMSTSDEKRSIAETLLKEAYQHAPDDFITDLMETIDYDNEKHGGIYVSRKIEICWDKRLANVLFKKFKEDHLKIKSKIDLLELLLSHNCIEAKRYAESILTASPPGDEEKRKESIKIASTLVVYAEGGSWDTIWPVIKRDTDFGKAVLTEIVEKSDRLSTNLMKGVSEEQLGDFYLWLVEQYPFHEDPHYDGVHDFDPRYSISFYRNSILDYLKEAGTPEAVKAIQRISLNLPELIQLKWVLYKAQKNAREKTWQPYKAADILKIAESYQKTLVQNENQLLDVLIESLKRLERKLHDETPASRDIWDHNPTNNKFRPIDENGFSDYVKRHLDEDLKKRGIVVNREVRIHRGERTDIQVDAVIKGNSEGVYDKITAIIEVKGCWNNELAYAMKTQLVERYLKDNICQHGLYLVGWFYCDLWDDQDSRKQRSPKIVKRKAQIKFDKQSLELSQNNITVKAFIMNTALKR